MTVETNLSSPEKSIGVKLILLALALAISLLYGFSHLLWLRDLNTPNISKFTVFSNRVIRAFTGELVLPILADANPSVCFSRPIKPQLTYIFLLASDMFMNKMSVTGQASFEEYQEKLTKDLYSELKKYRVDYLFYGPREQEMFKVDPEKTYSFLKKKYDDGIVKIYRIL